VEQRVVVTGMGAVTPLGLNLEDTWEALKAGRSGIERITLFDASAYPAQIAGEVKGFEPEAEIDRRLVKRMDRFTQFGVAAAQRAMAEAGLSIDAERAHRVGVLIGSGIGGIRTWEQQHQILLERGPTRVSPYLVPMMISDMAAGYVSIVLGAKGPNVATVSACASGAHAIGDAFEIIKRGDADVMIAGGAEAAVAPTALAGFTAMRALSVRNDDPPRASRPFDAERDGFVLGEGAGILVLESLDHARVRGGRIRGEIVGYGTSGDAHHISAPAPDGEGMARAMLNALADAGMEPAQIDYINAHAPGTPMGDEFEVGAMKQVFGRNGADLPAVSSTKSMTGHLLGAAGAVELAACLLAIRDQVIPPTINQESPDPECDIDCVPNQARRAKIETALSNSFGFGGHNVSLVVRAYHD
jgi:3-oxoacyl-[acyl-carrier-protein] synthase II